MQNLILRVPVPRTLGRGVRGRGDLTGGAGAAPLLCGVSAEWRKPIKSAGPCTLAGRPGRVLDFL